MKSKFVTPKLIRAGRFQPAQRFRQLCRDRMIEEIRRRTTISTIEHLQTVLSVIEQPGAFPIER
jgi:hypothetical protein